MADLIGQLVGNYRVKRVLGRGGMGIVYLAEHPRIGRQVAIKVLYPHVAQLPHAAERFEAEARIISRLRHPNVVDVYDFGALGDGSLYYVMESLHGVNLLRLLRHRGAMPPPLVSAFLDQICRALGAAHDRGVVHRDLKPDNIFVLREQSLVLKILDFGIAKILEPGPGHSASSTATGAVMGSPVTVAPEQAAGQSDQIGPHTDIYSLGVVLYWMLAGYPPFEDDSITLLLIKHIQDPPPPLPATVPPGVAALVLECLAKAPGDRPGPADEVARRFAAALEETVVDGVPSVVIDDDVLEDVAALAPDPDAPDSGSDPVAATELTPASSVHAAGGAAAAAHATTLHSAVGELTGPGTPRRRLSPFMLAVPLALILFAAATIGYLALRGGHDATRGADRPVAGHALTEHPASGPAARAVAGTAPDARAEADRGSIEKATAKPARPAKPRPKRATKRRPRHEIGDGTMEVDL